MLPQLGAPFESASAETIFRRTGSLSACRTAASSISERSGWGISSVVSAVSIISAVRHIVRRSSYTLLRYDNHRTRSSQEVSMKDAGSSRSEARSLRSQRSAAAVVAQYIHEVSRRGNDGRTRQRRVDRRIQPCFEVPVAAVERGV